MRRAVRGVMGWMGATVLPSKTGCGVAGLSGERRKGAAEMIRAPYGVAYAYVLRGITELRRLSTQLSEYDQKLPRHRTPVKP